MATFEHAFRGALAADAVAMPVHWYYDTAALDRACRKLTDYQAPKNPHSGSILWRSGFEPVNEEAEILHEQRQYWGQKGIHYHQFLEAGENTLNFRLATELYRMVVSDGEYDPERWLRHYVSCMRTPGWNKDTYLEEYHRGFFNNYARGRDLLHCGIDDIHIGGLAQVPALLAALNAREPLPLEKAEETVRRHVQLTHRSVAVNEAAAGLTRALYAIEAGRTAGDAIRVECTEWISRSRMNQWMRMEDRTVVGEILPTSCYLPESMTAALFFVWKYPADFSAGIIANARCGGDNCHRGAVVGSLLGAANGVSGPWWDELKARPVLEDLNPGEPHTAVATGTGT